MASFDTVKSAVSTDGETAGVVAVNYRNRKGEEKAYFVLPLYTETVICSDGVARDKANVRRVLLLPDGDVKLKNEFSIWGDGVLNALSTGVEVPIQGVLFPQEDGKTGLKFNSIYEQFGWGRVPKHVTRNQFVIERKVQ